MTEMPVFLEENNLEAVVKMTPLGFTVRLIHAQWPRVRRVAWDRDDCSYGLWTMGVGRTIDEAFKTAWETLAGAMLTVEGGEKEEPVKIQAPKRLFI